MLFEHIDTALPEHDFKRYSGGWRSKTYLDGRAHSSRADKTVVTSRAPGLILEQGGEILSLVDYVMSRDGVEFISAVRTLAERVGLDVPKGDYDQGAYQRYRDLEGLMADCNSYFTYCLQTSPGAEEVRSYLASRGYSGADIEAMELGYIPDQGKLITYLLGKGYSQSLIEENLRLNKGVGTSHRLTIPYRSGGSIKGFKFRTVSGAEPKYLNSTGLDRSGGFFNLSALKGDKDVVIVEGELDSLSATARGIENVVATGGSSVIPDQVKDAIRRGAKSFTLCLDMEPGKEEETDKRISSAIAVILAEGVNRVYVVTLPDLGDGKTDPDRLIKELGVDAFREAVKGATAYYQYQLQQTLTRYGKIQEERGLYPREIDSLLEEVVATSAKIPEPIDRDRYKRLFTDIGAVKELGITEESLSLTVDRLTTTKAKETQAKELQRLLTDASLLQHRGETGEALELLESKVKEVRLKDGATEFSSLLVPIKEADIRERLASRSESIDSGYTIGKEPLLLPPGAISVLSAPTSHGKTTLLVNMALNVATAYPDKQTYLFSYEEDGDSILINALNAYLDDEISSNNRRTLRSHFTNGSTEYIRRDQVEDFTATKKRFFDELIDTRRLNIHYSSFNSDTLIGAIRYLHKNANPGSIFIDYIQLLNLPEGKYKTYSRQEEMKQICIALKDVAVETGLPIVVGAQFNREVVNHLKLHPTKIGEAGDIERIASLIVGFWNNNFTPIAERAELGDINKGGGPKPGTIYATILKNRGGRVGLEETLLFNGNTGRIKNEKSPSPRGISFD